MGVMLAGLINAGIHTGKSHKSVSVREAANITDFRDKLDSRNVADTVQIDDGIVFGQLLSKRYHFVFQHRKLTLKSSQLFSGSCDQKLSVAVFRQSYNMPQAFNINILRFLKAEMVMLE